MERTKWVNGPHHLWFEPPDIVHTTIEAPASADEVIECVRIIHDDVLPHVSEVFLIVHMEPGGGLSAAGRKAAGGITPNWSGAAIVGGNPVQRAAMNVVFRAMSLLSAKNQPIRLVSTEEAAYAFINELRSASRARASNS